MVRSIPVVKREGKKISEEAEWLEVDKIISSRNEKINYVHRTVYITSEGEFLHCNATDQIHELLSEEEGFVVSDRGTLGNLNKKHEFDEKNKNIIFCNEYVITISKPRLEKVKEVMNKLLRKNKQ
ncbi:hypothetical protein ABHN03_25420 [Paenibacillus sp. NRS-1775]|uniref:hypothetical protein n=1 Tax=unclassified Paenibacillus TaxID=185978 RepID=UPI003D2AFFFC